MLEDFLDVVDEAHVEHFVGFVENEVGNVRQIHFSAVDEIDDSAGRSDDDVDAFVERAHLDGDRRAAVDGQDSDSRKAAEGGHFIGNLHGQFSRRCEDDRLDVARLFRDVLQDRDAERGCLSRTGPGLADDVGITVHEKRDRFDLDRRRVRETFGFEGIDDVF